MLHFWQDAGLNVDHILDQLLNVRKRSGSQAQRIPRGPINWAGNLDVIWWSDFFLHLILTDVSKPHTSMKANCSTAAGRPWTRQFGLTRTPHSSRSVVDVNQCFKRGTGIRLLDRITSSNTENFFFGAPWEEVVTNLCRVALNIFSNQPMLLELEAFRLVCLDKFGHLWEG